LKNLAKIGKMNMFLKYKIKSYQNILQIVFRRIDFFQWTKEKHSIIICKC
jgi:hypothetical protein